MTIYTVKVGGQGEGGTLPSIAAAARLAKAGDEVVLRGGVYRERLTPPAGTTWRAAEGERPVIDGGWPGTKNVEKADQVNQVLIRYPGVTLRGLEIANVPGTGVAVSAGGDGFVMEDCEIHHTVSSGLSVNGTGTPIRGITIRGCHVHDISLSGRWREMPIGGCFLFRYAEDVVVEDTVIGRGYGEGAAAGVQSLGLTFRRVTIHDMAHLLLYVSNRAQDVVVEDCVLYQSGLDEFRQGDGDVGTGLVVGDEVGIRSDPWRHAERVRVSGCLVVNAGSSFGLRNSKKIVGGVADGYDTIIRDLVVERCTFVAGPDSRGGVGISENVWGSGTVAGVFKECVFIMDGLTAGDVVNSNAPGVTFQFNCFSPAVPEGVGVTNAAVSAAALVNPLSFGGAFNVDNYRPRPGGPLAPEGVADVGALEPLFEEPPPPPPPPPPPWRERLEERERVLVANCELSGPGPEWTPDGWVYGLVGKLAGLLDGEG